MWSSLQTTGRVDYERGDDKKYWTPTTRSRHAICVAEDGHIYLMGGRSTSRPLKDLWQLDPAQNEWEEVKCKGDHPPNLQEHTIIAWGNKLYVFGGEVGLSSTTESPLWILDLATCIYRRLISSPINSKSASSGLQPSGRRGHTAVLYKDAMHIHGGYQDLRGSLSELWTLDLRSEQWTLMSCTGRCFLQPSPRYSHSAVVYQDCMWIYGGLTDLREQGDFWRWSFVEHQWSKVNCNKGPGKLYAHSAITAFDSMIIFGGERNGKLSQDLWQYHFDLKIWEKIQIDGLLPNPRSRHTAIVNPFLDSFHHQKYKKQENKNNFISNIFSIRNSSKAVPLKSISMFFGQIGHTALHESSKPNKPFKLKHSMSINLCSKITNTLSDDEDESTPNSEVHFNNHTEQVSLRKAIKNKLVRSRLVKSLSSSNYNILHNHHNGIIETNKQEDQNLIEQNCHHRACVYNAFSNSANKFNRKSMELANQPNSSLSRIKMQKSLSSSPVLELDCESFAPQPLYDPPENPCLTKQRPMSEVVDGMPGIEGLLEAIDDLHWPSENIMKRHSVHETMSYYSLCFPSPPGSDRTDQESPSSPSDNLINRPQQATHVSYTQPEVLRGFLKEDQPNRQSSDSNGNYSEFTSPQDRSKSSGYNSLLTLYTPSVESREMPHSSSHCSGYQSFTDETFYDPKEMANTFTHSKIVNPVIPRRYSNRVQREPSFELKTLNPMNPSENTGGVTLRLNSKDIRARSALRNSGNFSYRGSNCENGLWAEENVIKEVVVPSSPALQKWSYSPSKTKLNQNHWQICMYVFGGREEGASLGHRQPISAWKLYI